MARRFRKLRRAAHQVIEVTRNFWRFCHCCGTMRAEISLDVIPVSSVLSSTNLPRARTLPFSWHCCTRQSTREGNVVIQTSVPSFIGPQHWVRPTNPGVQPAPVTSNCSQSGQDVPGTYMPGSFSREHPIPSSTSVGRGGHQLEEESLNYNEFRASRFPPPWPLRTEPIWSVSSSSQTDDHVPLRSQHESRISRTPVESQESIPRNWGSSNPVDAFRSPSGRLSIDTVGRDYQMNPSLAAGGPLTSRTSNIFTGSASINNITSALASVENIPSPRRTRFQRFDENDKYLGYLPSPSGSNLVVAPSPFSRSSRVLPKPVATVKVVPSIPSSNPIDALRSPSGKLCIDMVGSHSRCCHPCSPTRAETNQINSRPSSYIGLHGIVGSNNLVASPLIYKRSLTIAGSSNTRLVSNDNNRIVINLPSLSVGSSRALALTRCSNADPELRLNLGLLRDSSTGVVTSLDLRVEFAIKSEWNNMDPENWHQRYTITRTKCGTVDVAYCDTFRKNFALKTLSPVSGQTEVETLRQCQGPFVVEMHAVLSQGDDKLLCTSYYEKLDLAHWLRKDEKREHFTEKEAALICSYILTGLEFIHNKGILHLDIKPGNIFLCDKGYPVLGDFGSARNVNSNTHKLRHFTPAYASPEVLNGEIPTTQADLWSTACVFYEIVAGRSPYQGKYAAVTELRILAGSTPNVSMMSIDNQHFICAQFQSDKTNRLGFSFGAREVMRHRVFHKINWDEVRYCHRHYDCPLAEVLRVLDKSDGEIIQTSSSSTNNYNNSSRWELWSSSSSDEDTDEEFDLTSRELSTVEEADEEFVDLDGPLPDDAGKLEVVFKDSGG